MISMTEDKEADNKVVPFFRFVTNKPIFVEFLSKFLNIREVGKLDLALTNTKYRFAFLKSLEEMRNNSINGMFCNDSLLGDHSSPHFLRSAEPMFKAGHSKTLLTWISKRRIDVKSINLFNFKDGEEALFIGSLQLSVRQLDVTRCSLRHIAQSCPFLEELTINESSMDVDSDLLTDLVFLCRHCTHLQRIHLKRVTLQSAALNDLQEFGHLFVEIDTHARQGLVTNPRFFEFIKRCTNLKVFSIFNANPQKPSLSNFGIIMRLEALEELTVIDCGLTNEKLALICACRHVKKLSLFEHSWTEGVFTTFNGAGFGVLNGSPLSLTLESITIDLNGWDFDVRSINGAANNSAIAAGLATCKNLRSVSLHMKRLGDDEFLETMSAGCPLLETVHAYCRYVTIEGLRQLVQRCVRLKEVSVEPNYPVNDVDALKSTFPGVRWNLECMDGSEIEDDDDDGNY